MKQVQRVKFYEVKSCEKDYMQDWQRPCWRFPWPAPWWQATEAEPAADNAPTTAQAVNALPLEARAEYAGQFWRLDAAEDGSLPENFRLSSDAVGTVDGILPETAGLAELHSSGSAQMSQSGMEKLMAQLCQATSGPIYIVDLRQETHGYLDWHCRKLLWQAELGEYWQKYGGDSCRGKRRPCGLPE